MLVFYILAALKRKPKPDTIRFRLNMLKLQGLISAFPIFDQIL